MDITVIIPVHMYDDTVKPLLEKAVNSVEKKYNIIISCGNDIVEQLETIYGKTNNVSITSTENTSFQSLVNNGVAEVKTEWFSILEFDDVYTDIWFTNAEKYKEFKSDVSVFVPLEDLIDYSKETNNFIGYGNEAVWASSFSTDLGYIDNDCLQNFFDFYITGSIFKTEDWIECGGLKESIKLTFWYEFLLRMTYNGKKFFVIPKIGYVHYLNRDGSLINKYSNEITEKESQQWINLAKQEYFFKKDRNKTIENNEEEN